ncbi:MAG: trigger factor [Chloroflexi bacterium]|nr:MAG: trigger factor [Chloroflexota bacterium]
MTNGGRSQHPALYFAVHERHRHARAEERHQARDRAPPGAPEPRRRRRRSAPLPADQGSRLPARQGAPTRPRAGARSRRSPRRGGRAPGPGRLPRGAHREGDPADRQRRRRRRPEAEEGKPVIFTATVPIRPEVQLGDFRNFNFRPEIETIDDARVDKVVEELRDQNGTLAPVEDRGARNGDYAVISFEGTRDGQPFEGGSSERMPLILGEERLIPGFETHLEGLRVGESTEFDITFPDDYAEESLRGQPVHFRTEVKELREKVLPDADDAFAQSMGDFAGMAEMRAEIRPRLERNALDRARHQFADKIIDYAVANATIDLPDVLIDQEVEVLHDELRSSLARQGISQEAYLKVLEKSEADLHADLRPRAEERVKTLLVLSKIAEVEGIAVPDADVEDEVARGRERYAGDRKLIAYFESERGRNFIRSTLRRTQVVERLVDDWLAAHPEHVPLPHVESGPTSAAEAAAVAAGEIPSAEAAEAGESTETAGPAESPEPTATGSAG